MATFRHSITCLIDKRFRRPLAPCTPPSASTHVYFLISISSPELKDCRLQQQVLISIYHLESLLSIYRHDQTITETPSLTVLTCIPTPHPQPLLCCDWFSHPKSTRTAFYECHLDSSRLLFFDCRCFTQRLCILINNDVRPMRGSSLWRGRDRGTGPSVCRTLLP